MRIATKLLLLCIVALSLVSLVGCTTDEHTATLIRNAERIAIEHPDSALRILSPISNASIRSRKLQAKHALLLSYALDKCYINVDRDTLIRIAYDYFDTSRDANSKMLSNYLMGMVNYNASDNSTSLVYFLNAEEYAKDENNSFYLGLIYRYMSHIYGRVYCDNEALICGEKSLEHFKRHGDKLYIDWAIVELGRLYHNAKEYTNCIALYDNFLRCKNYSDNPALHAEALRNLASAYMAIDNIPECIAAYESALRLDSTALQGNDYAMLGASYARMGNISEAKGVMHKVEKNSDREFLLYCIYSHNKDYEKALCALESAYESQNKSLRTLSTQNISSIGIEYFRYKENLKKQQLKESYFLISIICIIFCSAVSLILVKHHYRSKIHKRELDENISLAVDLRNRVIAKEDLLLNQQILIEQLFSSHFDAFNRLSSAYYECKGLRNEKEKIHNEVVRIISTVATDATAVKKMEEFINRYKDNLIIKFNKSFPDFSRSEVNLYIYIVLGFSARAISIFLNENIDVIYNRKSRLKQKIQKSKAFDKDLFLESMS